MTTEKALESWVRRIDNQEMPIFQSSVSAIAQMAANDETSASELARTILRDPSLAARILKFANSQFYRSSAACAVSTVSHAVVMLGFEVVRELSLSLSIIDSLLGKEHRQNLAKRVAYSFLSAVQARALAEKMGCSNLEEVFIAALLYDLGEMAFWCIASQQEVEELEKALQTRRPEAAQNKVLGFCFRDLTRRLVTKWNIRATLEEALKDDEGGSGVGRIIRHGKELTRIANNELDALEERKTLKAIAKFVGMGSEDLRTMVSDNVKVATEIGHAFSPMILKYFAGNGKKDAPHPELAALEFPEPDPLLQLKILRELSTMLQTRPDLNLVLEALLEGIYRGVGMDRALFALYNSNKKEVKAKFVLAAQGDWLMENFVFPVGSDSSNPFYDVLFERRHGVWVQSTRISTYDPVIMHQIWTLLQVKSFFITPIIVNNHAIGIFYGDRQPSSRVLDEDSFASFEHLGQQAGISIDYISHKGRG